MQDRPQPRNPEIQRRFGVPRQLSEAWWCAFGRGPGSGLSVSSRARVYAGNASDIAKSRSKTT